MRKHLVCGCLALGLGCAPASVLGQNVGGSIHVGTLGLGARVTLEIASRVNVRGGIDFQPVTFDTDLSDVTYELDLPSPSLSALVDWHPGGSGFRLSGGLGYFANDMELTGTPLAPVEIGGQEYEPSEIGTIIGQLGTSALGPYLGLGWGDATGGGFGFAFDLGVVFHGTPDVSLRVTGPIEDDPGFQQELDRELEDVNDEVSSAKVYPVLNLGFSFGL